MAEGSELKATITVPFPSIREADIAYQVLRVDPEPKRSGVRKDVQVERDTLTVNLFASKPQQLRVAVTSLMENLISITETMEQFGPPRSVTMPEHTPAPTPSRAVYGFVLYLCCYSAFALYFVWAVIPDSFLHSLGLTYLPQKYWAVAVPIHVGVAVALFAAVIYPAINLTMTPPFDDPRTVTDPHALRLRDEMVPSGGIPPVSDIPISQVCRHLYMDSN